MTSYLGNPTLAEAIRERVLSTFGQTLTLAEEGKRQEALLGCEFILKLDPLFEPARALQRRVQETEGPVAVQDFARLLEPQHQAPTPEWNLAGELADLLDRREFRNVLSLAEQHRARVGADADLSRLVAEARSRLEAEPYVRSFLDRALQLRKDGHEQEAEAVLAKARQLDPTHPELAGVSAPPVAVPGLLAAVPQLAEGAPGDDRIARLLVDGQQAFDRGDYQGAIDSWSRIFLIDIDHGEANRRIEEARRLKAERERQLEELFHEGVSLWELGSSAQARRVFERVLEMDPGHLAARDMIERIEAGETAAPTPVEHAELVVPPDVEAAVPSSAPPPPAPAARARRPPAAVAAPKGKRLRPSFLVIGGAVLLVALLGAWLLYSRRQGLFPNSAQAAAAGEVDSEGDALALARALHDKGQTAGALAQLRRLPSTHPQYEEAQTLAAQWETIREEVTPASPERLAERAGVLTEARAAAGRREYLRAVELLERGEAISALEATDRQLLEQARRETAELARELEFFRQGDWEFALPDLWRRHEADPANPDVRRLMVDSYYNLAVRDLQRQDVREAAAKVQEGLALAPQDAGLQRLARVADLYSQQPLDLRYRIFVKYLPFR